MHQLTHKLWISVFLIFSSPAFAVTGLKSRTVTEAERTHIFIAEPAEVHSLYQLSTSLTEEDLRMTKRLRAELRKADISSRAKEILMNVEDGRVTLGGMVASEAEMRAVQQIAEKVAGRSNVTNELFVQYAD